ncbi:MAG: alpha/beta hydrolase [Methylophilaceae bacterium]
MNNIVPNFLKRRYLLNALIVVFMTVLLPACEDVYALAHKVKVRLSALIQSNEADAPSAVIPMVSGVKIIKDVAYGDHKKQSMDIYVPENVSSAPIILMLHGGGWSSGDKGDALIYINKVNRWVPKGFIVISMGTRLMPDADVYTQIGDLSRAVATVQKRAAEWGGDTDKLMLMGHSSAGTMVSVLAANPSLVTDLGGKRWLASFSLDSSSLDIPRTMRLWQPEMFSYAYGKDSKKWPAASPINLLNSQSIPLFIACSTQRGDGPCEQAALFVEQAKKFNITTKITEQNFNHGEVNDRLGTDGEYTNTAEAFMASLDVEVAARLNVEK